GPLKRHVTRRTKHSIQPGTGRCKQMPIVEFNPDGVEPPALSPDLERRIRQQDLLAELGVTALQGASFNQLLDDAARLTAEGMQAEFCKILEHDPAQKCFLVRAGVGWEPG